MKETSLSANLFYVLMLINLIYNLLLYSKPNLSKQKRLSQFRRSEDVWFDQEGDAPSQRKWRRPPCFWAAVLITRVLAPVRSHAFLLGAVHLTAFHHSFFVARYMPKEFLSYCFCDPPNWRNKRFQQFTVELTQLQSKQTSVNNDASKTTSQGGKCSAPTNITDMRIWKVMCDSHARIYMCAYILHWLKLILQQVSPWNMR